MTDIRFLLKQRKFQEIARAAQDDPGIMVDLLEVFEDPDKYARSDAAWALRVIAEELPSAMGPLQVSALTAALDDPHKHTRLWAAEALRVLADTRPGLLEAAVPQLAEALANSYELVRSKAAETFSVLARQHVEMVRPAVPALVKGLADPYERTRLWAREALKVAALGDPTLAASLTLPPEKDQEQ